MKSDKQYADLGDAVTLTCAFTDPSDLTATVTWYKNTSPISTGITKPSAGKSIMTIASTAYTDNAEYKCKVDFGGTHGSRTGTSLKQYVRGVETDVKGTQYPLRGSALTYTCTVHGDVLSKDVVWTNTAGAITEATYSQDTKAYSASAYTTTSTLGISSASTADTTSFTCTVEYTQGSVEKTSTIDVQVLCKLISSWASVFICKFLN